MIYSNYYPSLQSTTVSLKRGAPYYNVLSNSECQQNSCQYYQHHEWIISYVKKWITNFISYLLALSVIKDVGFKDLKCSSGNKSITFNMWRNQGLCSYQFIEPFPRNKLGPDGLHFDHLNINCVFHSDQGSRHRHRHYTWYATDAQQKLVY